MSVTGKVKMDASTKRLVPRLLAGDIAVIDHEDLDEVASGALLQRRPAAVLNLKASISERYPHQGPLSLLKSGIPLVDCVKPELSSILQ